MSGTQYNRGLHIVALLTAVATFPLIFMGGLVTSHQAGMSVPDWPNSYGYNMFLFPPRLWIGGILYEHTHRLMGTVVGMLSIVLCIWAWKVEPRRWVRWLAVGVLAAVILQGVVGGLRVVLVNLDLAIVHACFAQAFFCLTALMCIVTSKWWQDRRTTGSQPLLGAQHGLKTRDTNNGVVHVAVAAVIVVYLQLIIGATMRHYQAGLAIPDLPLAYGKLLPPATTLGLAEVNAHRAWQLHEAPVSLTQVWLHFGHRVGAIIVTLVLGAVIFRAIRDHRTERKLVTPAVVLALLLLIQLTLGVLTVLWKKPADVASTHVAVGALILVTTFTICIRAARLRVVQGATAHDPTEWRGRPAHADECKTAEQTDLTWTEGPRHEVLQNA